LLTLGADPIWRQVPAVRAGRVHEIPGAWIATVSHHAAQGLARVARLLHPQAFPV
jgi:ABC-type Fe3+-hydroxamate transport system substrate-binding protein